MNNNDFDPSKVIPERYEETTTTTPYPVYGTGNGAKPRYDGKGSEFGLVHRDLGPGYCMFDVDRMSATIEVGLELKRENECFVEYRHRPGDIAFIAMFEVKAHKTEFSLDALNPKKSVSSARLKMAQLMDCRLFVVYGNGGKQPFEFYEIDTTSGDYQVVGTLSYAPEEKQAAVKAFWNEVLGIKR